MNTPEQQASEMLVLGVALSEKDMQALHDWAIKLRQPIIAERDALKAELAAIKRGAGEPVAWALWLPGENTPRQLHLSKDASQSAERRWPEAYQGCAHVPLYTRPAVPLTEESIRKIAGGGQFVDMVFADGARGIALDAVTICDFARAIEAHIKGA